MLYLDNKKGFTLLELIISMAIIGLLTVSFLEMFTFGFKGVFSAGQNSKAQYLGQQVIENKLAGVVLPDPAYITSNEVVDSIVTLNFKLSGEADVIIEVEGKIEKVKYDNGKYRVDLATFLPY